MKRTSLLLLALVFFTQSALSQGTAFTYQGRLTENGSPGTALRDFEFRLFSVASNGSAVASAVVRDDVGDTNGLFTVVLDFGFAFDGQQRFLEIAVRPGDSAGPFTTLAPRQKVTAAPYAMTAGALTGTLPSGSFAGYYQSPVNLINSANQFQGSFSGDGSGLANLPASSLRLGGLLEIGTTRFDELPGVGGESIAGSHQLAVGDFNGDGWRDIAQLGSMDTSATSLAVYTNNTRSGFALMWQVNENAGGFPPGAITAADVNGDGAWDLYRANTGQGTAGSSVSLFYGSATTMTLAGSIPTGTRPVALHAADFNLDGRPDLVTANASAPNFQVFINTGGGLPSLAGTYPYPTTPYAPGGTVYMDSADLNGDGRRDLVACIAGDTSYLSARVCLFTNGGGVTLASATNYGYAEIGEFYMQFTGVRCVDVNDDNIPEIVFSSYDPSGASLRILKRESFGTAFSVWKRVAGHPGISLAAADFNFDGAVDFVVGDQVLGNDGRGNFAVDKLLPAFNFNGDVSVAADFTGDGLADIFTAGNNVKRLFRNNAGLSTRGRFEILNNAGTSRFLVDEQGLRLLATNGATLLNISGTDGAFQSPVIFNNTVTHNSNVSINNVLSFGSSTRQMINLFESNYGIGVQNNTLYFRAGLNDGQHGFAWYVGGTHNNTAQVPGAGGAALMTLNGQKLEARVSARITSGGGFFDPQLSLVQANAPFDFARLRMQAGGPAWDIALSPDSPSSMRFWNGSADNFVLHENGNATLRGTLTQNSDRHVKERLEPVNARDVLAKVSSLSISTWSYTNSAGTRHLGPMAQDFRAAFGLGETDRGIASVDADGVALAAIQGLNQKVEDLSGELKRRETENAELKLRLEKLEQLMSPKKGDVN